MTARDDLQSALTADLRREASRPAPLPTATPPPPLPPLPMAAGTPALSVRLTPLRWSRPTLDSAEAGAGMAVRFGPFRVEICL